MFDRRQAGKMKHKKSQITIEYFLFLALMVMVLLIVIGKKDSKIQKGVNQVVTNMGDQVTSLIPNN